MAINTYSIVAIFVSILGVALILAISWLLYTWSRTSKAPAQSHAWPLTNNTQEHNPYTFASSPSQHFAPTQRLMIQHGRVVPHRQSLAPSSRSGLSSVRYSGWLASGQSVNQASSIGDAASVRSGRLSRFSSRAGRRTPPADLESSVSIYSDTNHPPSDLPPMPPSPLSPSFHSPRETSRLYSQLRSKRFQAPSVRSHHSSTSSTASDDADEKAMKSPANNAHWSTIIEESSPAASGHNSGYNSRPVSTALTPLVAGHQPSPKQSSRQSETARIDERDTGNPLTETGEQQRRTRLFAASFFENSAQSTSSRESLAVHPPMTGDSTSQVRAAPSVPARDPSPGAAKAWESRSAVPLQSKFHVSATGSQSARVSRTAYGAFDFGLGASGSASMLARPESTGDMRNDTATGARSNTMGSEDSEMLSALPKSPGFSKFDFGSR